jgi:catechol 2,3-dioxygenase-like lactoylglutathione lyase family enzyme
MAVQHVFAGIPVADYPSARDWYERLFGRPPDLVPHETEAAWQLSDTAWIYVVADADRAGDALLTIMVDDLEAQVSELADRGLATAAMETAPGLFRKAELRDADGNTIAFGEDLSGES